MAIHMTFLSESDKYVHDLFSSFVVALLVNIGSIQTIQAYGRSVAPHATIVEDIN